MVRLVSSSKKKADQLPELENVKVFGFLMVIACHFWVLHYLPYLFGHEQRPVGLGIDASQPARIDLQAWFPAFQAHEVVRTICNLVFGFGYQGVGLFFILTGFGLTLSALNRPRFEPWPYLVARFERVYLPYLLLLAVYTVFAVVTGEKVKLDLRALVLMDTGIPFAWFMFPLLQFYLLFPLLFLLTRLPGWSPGKVLGAAIGLNVAWAFATLWAGYNLAPVVMEPGACAPKGLIFFRIAEPVYGMWLAYLYRQRREFFRYLLSGRCVGLHVVVYLSGCGLSLAESNLHLGGYTWPLGQAVCNLLISVGLFNLLFVVGGAVHRRAPSVARFGRYSLEYYLLQSIPLAGLAWVLSRGGGQFGGWSVWLPIVALVNLGLAIAMHHGSAVVLRRTYYAAKAWFVRANDSAMPGTAAVRVGRRPADGMPAV